MGVEGCVLSTELWEGAGASDVRFVALPFWRGRRGVNTKFEREVGW